MAPCPRHRATGVRPSSRRCARQAMRRSPATTSPCAARPTPARTPDRARPRRGPEVRLRVARRVHQRGDVSAGREHEAQIPDSEQPGTAITGLPRRYVVGDPRHHVGVGGQLVEVHRRAQHAYGAWRRKRIMQTHRHHVPVQCRRHPCGVGVPVQDVERRRRLALDVVVHPVAPYQVRRPQPCEHLRQRSTVQISLAGRQRDGDVGGLFVDGRCGEAGLPLIENRDHECQPGEPLALTRRVEMRGRHRGENPPGAGRLQMRAIGLGDLLDGVQRVQDRLAVGVETPILLFCSGIAP